jgi:hypothetical protein
LREKTDTYGAVAGGIGIPHSRFSGCHPENWGLTERSQLLERTFVNVRPVPSFFQNLFASAVDFFLARRL